MIRYLVASAVLLAAFAAYAGFSTVGAGTRVTCGTTPTKLDDTSVTNIGERYVLITNLSLSENIVIGNSAVTLTTGTPVKPEDRFPSGDKIVGDNHFYCVSASGTAPAIVQEYR